MGTICSQIKKEFQCLWFGFTDCHPSSFTTLQWTSNLNWVFLYRFLVFIYTLSWFIADVTISLVLGQQEYSYFVYMTHWGEIIMLVYFSSALIVLNTEKHQINNRHAPLRWYHKIVWILFDVYVTSAILITISYNIGIAFDDEIEVESNQALNIHVHVINSVLAVIELTLNNLPVRILHFYWPLLFGAIYSIFTYIYYVTTGISKIYPVLDWNDSVDTAYFIIFMLFIGVLFIHAVIVWMIYRFRIYIFEKKASIQPSNDSNQNQSNNYPETSFNL